MNTDKYVRSKSEAEIKTIFFCGILENKLLNLWQIAFKHLIFVIKLGKKD